MNLSDFDYNLPKELIAQYPYKKRENSRLMVLNRYTGQILHKKFKDILDFLNCGDVLVLNKSKVIPARLFGKRFDTGAKMEVLLLNKPVKGKSKVLIRTRGKLKENERIILGNGLLEAVLLNNCGKIKTIQFLTDNNFILMDMINKIGNMPLPPYIKRAADTQDKNAYQTVYAKEEGSIAAPTAGLHFSKEFMLKIKERGIITADIVLHVSYATFSPVKENDITKHQMHEEYFSISAKSKEIIKKAKKENRRIISVGTTSCRVLETAYNEILADLSYLENKKTEGKTKLFIYPPYNFKLTDGLITNLHFPKSTLLFLVSAFAGKDFIFKAYKEAVNKKYRFFSYGDCMLII